MSTPEIDYPPPVPDTPPVPYERAVQIPLEDQPLNLTQLTDELAQTTGKQVEVAVSEVDGHRQLSVVPGNLKAAVVQQVLANHTPVEGYEIPAEEKAFAELLARAASASEELDLTPAELQVAVLGLLRRTTSVAPRRR